MSSDAKYLATKAAKFLYPEVGDPKPPHGAKVSILTEGGIQIEGQWRENGGFLGWHPLIGRDRDKEDLIQRRRQKLKEEQAKQAASKA